MENYQGLSKLEFKSAYLDILHWKNPIVTGGLLLLLNVGFIVYQFLDISLLTLGTYELLAYIVYAIIKRKYTGEDCK